jgi:hypothetical protein
MDIKSPFSLSEEEVRTLEHNEGFRIVRAYLSSQENQENHPYASQAIFSASAQELTTL